MSKAMTIHHTINLVLVMGLVALNYFNISNLAVSIILALIITINAALLIRANRKKVERDGVTIDDYKKKWIFCKFQRIIKCNKITHLNLTLAQSNYRISFKQSNKYLTQHFFVGRTY